MQDVDKLAEAVDCFIQMDHSDKEQMGRKSREKMEREFDRKIVTNIYLEEINKIINTQR